MAGEDEGGGRDSQSELEAEIAQLTSERHELFARLARLESERADYTIEVFTMAAHELSTPLQSLLMATDSMVQRLGRADLPLAREWLARQLDTQQRTLVRLVALLRAWLIAPQLRAGTLPVQLEPCDLADLVRELLDRQQDELTWARCSLVQQLQSICGNWDRLRLETALWNLLDNAAKYGAGKPITVTTSRQADVAIITVRDEGAGIAECDRERIFERFERAQGANRVSGFGVGLWMTRALLNDIGGSVSVESTLGAGSTFTVRLPIAT